MTKKEEEEYVASLNDIKGNILSPGEKTRRILKSRKIVSPSITGMIQISTTPPTWIVPKKQAKKNKKKK